LSRSFRRLGFLTLFLLLIAGLLAATHSLWLHWMGQYLIEAGPPCKADVIVVLAGDPWGNRITKAGDLVRQGWAPKALISGAGFIYGVNEGDLAIQYAVKAGYPADGFFSLPSPARSTVGEAQYILDELRKRGVHRFILVTSDFHTRRATGIYRKADPDIPFCVVAAPDPDFSAGDWWHNREGRKIAFIEWCKTIANAFGI
jgi:uncharacterized SAM-binding protein YcdF (DUF218 family)